MRMIFLMKFPWQILDINTVLLVVMMAFYCSTRNQLFQPYTSTYCLFEQEAQLSHRNRAMLRIV